MSLELTDWDLELILQALEKDNIDVYSYDRRDRHIYTIKITLIKKVMNEIGLRRIRGYEWGGKDSWRSDNNSAPMTASEESDHCPKSPG